MPLSIDNNHHNPSSIIKNQLLACNARPLMQSDAKETLRLIRSVTKFYAAPDALSSVIDYSTERSQNVYLLFSQEVHKFKCTTTDIKPTIISLLTNSQANTNLFKQAITDTFADLNVHWFMLISSDVPVINALKNASKKLEQIIDNSVKNHPGQNELQDILLKQLNTGVTPAMWQEINVLHASAIAIANQKPRIFDNSPLLQNKMAIEKSNDLFITHVFWLIQLVLQYRDHDTKLIFN